MNGISNREDDTSNLEKLEIQPVKLGLPELKEIGAKWLVDMATYISNNPRMDSFFGFALLWNARIKGTLGGLLEVDRQYLLPVTVQWMIPPLHRKSEHTRDTFVGKLMPIPSFFTATAYLSAVFLGSLSQMRIFLCIYMVAANVVSSFDCIVLQAFLIC